LMKLKNRINKQVKHLIKHLISNEKKFNRGDI
jgi:hypothetical protein